MKYKVNTPVVLFTFNRPDNLKKLLNVLADLEIYKIYFISDGPRNNDDLEKVNLCREIINGCKLSKEKVVYTNKENFGCKRNFFYQLHNIFNIEDRVIVLEDDCIPTVEFFRFVEWGLDNFEKNDSVSLISGSNLLDNQINEDSICFNGFSQYINIWGWAGWKTKTWDILNPYLSISNLPELNGNGSSFNRLSFWEKVYWKNIFKHAVYSHKIWDFYLQFSFFKYNRVSVYPRKNLIYNIGFDENATHTSNGVPEYVKLSQPDLFISKMFDQQPKYDIEINDYRDELLVKTIWNFSIFTALRLFVMNIFRYIK